MSTFIIEGNAGVGGAAVALSGDASASTVADTQGNFQFGNLGAGNYTVTPTLDGYTFAGSGSVVVASNVLGTNFVATLTSDSAATSTKDCRTAPNSSLNVGGTQLNVVTPTPSVLAPVDSRTSVPADSRTSKPVNSRNS